MNYFIDFDHTLYNVSLLKKDMLCRLSQIVSENSSENFDSVLNFLTEKFKRGENNIYDIYELIDFCSTVYSFDIDYAINNINKIILNGKKYLFEDSISFLSYLKNNGNKIYILSYNELKVYFQALKISGSGICDLVDGIIPTTTLKGDFPLDFSNCIFIDDKPKDLISIYNRNPLAIYRIRRPNDIYSNLETNLPIPEFSNLKKLQFNIENKH